jgi:hypothetical protein
MSQVIYARVPSGVKEAADIYSSDRGMTLTAAVVDLLERGLAAVTDESSIAELERKLNRVTSEKTEAESELKVARSELTVLRAFAERATRTKVGKCPGCQREITGYDLLGTGQCPKCERSLLDLLAPAHNDGLDQREFGLLVGALGAALVGAVLLGKGSQGA